MMSTPADLEDMGIGFAIAEGIVGSAAEIAAVEVLDMVLGMEVRLEIPAARAAALDERRRSMVGGTACGLCGIISLDMAIRPLPKASAGLKVQFGRDQGCARQTSRGADRPIVRPARCTRPPWRHPRVRSC